MSALPPPEIATALVSAATKKSMLPHSDWWIRGFLSGGLLALATMMAFTVASQTGQPYLGALAFPVSFVIIMLLSLELVTGNFATMPMALADKKLSLGGMTRNWTHVFLANLVGSVFIGAMLWAALSKFGHTTAPGQEYLISVATSKTLAYKEMGVLGWAVVFLKAALCNWLVTLGVVMAFVTNDATGKILAIWLPIFTFFALGLEHCVVNMFVMPTAMLFGAPISISDWWLWNQIPATLGNVIGAVCFTAMPMWWTFLRETKCNL